MNNKKEEIYLYNISTDREKGQKIHTILNKLNIGIKYISESMLSETLRACIEATCSEEEGTVYSFDSEVMVINGLSDEKLGSLLNAMRDERVSVELKAAVTEHNRDWRIIDLFREIEKEHLLMAGVDKLSGLMRSAFAIDLNSMPMYAKMELMEAVSKGHTLLNAEEPPTEKELSEAVSVMEKVLKKYE